MATFPFSKWKALDSFLSFVTSQAWVFDQVHVIRQKLPPKTLGRFCLNSGFGMHSIHIWARLLMTFSPPSICIEPSGGIKSSQQGGSFYFSFSLHFVFQSSSVISSTVGSELESSQCLCGPFSDYYFSGSLNTWICLSEYT